MMNFGINVASAPKDGRSFSSHPLHACTKCTLLPAHRGLSSAPPCNSATHHLNKVILRKCIHLCDTDKHRFKIYTALIRFGFKHSSWQSTGRPWPRIRCSIAMSSSPRRSVILESSDHHRSMRRREELWLHALCKKRGAQKCHIYIYVYVYYMYNIYSSMYMYTYMYNIYN